jgi:hypothetical protein
MYGFTGRNFDCQFVACALTENEVSTRLHAVHAGLRCFKLRATFQPKRASVRFGSEDIKRCNHGDTIPSEGQKPTHGLDVFLRRLFVVQENSCGVH